jgi:hypothetical protein
MEGTMCDGGHCPQRKKCLRFTDKPSHWQNYYVEPPFVVIQKGTICDKFWDNKKEDEK